MWFCFTGPGPPRSQRHRVWVARSRVGAGLRVGVQMLAGAESIVTAWLGLPPLHRCLARFAAQVRTAWRSLRWHTPTRPLAELTSPVLTGEVIFHPSTHHTSKEHDHG